MIIHPLEGVTEHISSLLGGSKETTKRVGADLRVCL